MRDSNPRHSRCKRDALPTELIAPNGLLSFTRSVAIRANLFYNGRRTVDNGPRTIRAMTAQIVEINDPNSGSSARVLVSLGFNCFSWRPALNDGPREMLWADAGFEAGDKRPSGSGIPLLFPFPGRISGAKYQFEGRDYELEPGDAFGNAIHGFVFNRPWRVVEQQAARVVGEFQASVDDPTILKRWPADFRIRVAYEVRGQDLISDIQYENTGEGPLPCGFATHAYFRLPLSKGGVAAETVVTAPVKAFWELEQIVPTGRIFPVSDDDRLTDGVRLGDHQFDTVFTQLRPDADGMVRTQLADPISNRTLTQTFDTNFTQCVVYIPPHREAICLEPYTCVPNAIQLAAEGHETGLQILQPGQRFKTTIRLNVT
jgi:aldose 1-epimerase